MVIPYNIIYKGHLRLALDPFEFDESDRTMLTTHHRGQVIESAKSKKSSDSPKSKGQADDMKKSELGDSSHDLSSK